MKPLFSFLFLLLALWSEGQLPAADSVRPLSRADSLRIRRADSIRQREAFRLDSVRQREAFRTDSVRRYTDSVRLAAFRAFRKGTDTAAYANNPFFRFRNPVRLIATEREWTGKESLFYSLLALLLYFALIRSGFSRYLQDLFRLFLRTTLKQKQIREHLLQSPLPSLLFNILFILSGALFITLLLQHFHLGNRIPFWMLFLYSVAGLAAVYLVKFITLKLMGWILYIREATDAYLFVVFTTNKVVGIVLLPFLLLLAFSGGAVYQGTLSVAFLLLGGLFLYRFFLAYLSVHRMIRINVFHFFIYLLAMEIVPLLLINKLLVRFFLNSY